MMTAELSANPLEGAARRMELAQAQVLDGFAAELEAFYRTHWTGWRNPTGASRAGWMVRRVGQHVEVRNREDYAATVRKAGSSLPEVEILQQQINQTLLPELASRMAKALAGASTGRPEL